MKTLMTLVFSMLFTLPAFADFIDYHQQLFNNYNLCDSKLSDQVSAEAQFKKMFNILLNDDQQEQESSIEVLDYSAYTTRLKNTETNAECSILLHDDCYSAYCD